MIAAAAGGEILSRGLDMIFGRKDDKRQYAQQKKMQALQIKGQKEMGEFNQGLAIDTWNKTNYEAQRKHMENAGLNVGLMYEGAGQGGTTTQTGNVSGGDAPIREKTAGMGMQLALQMAMQKAQIENIEATTQKTKTETEKIGGIDTAEAATRITKLAQDTANEKIKGEILKWEEQLKIIELNVADKNQHQLIEQMKQLTTKIKAETQKAVAEGKIAKETAEANIKLVKQSLTEQALRIAGQKLGLTLTKEQIDKISTEIMQMGVSMSQNERKLRLEQIANEWNTGQGATTKRTTETIKMYVNMVTDMLEALME